MSPIASSGLVGVSSQTSVVSPGRIAARTAAGSVTGAGLWASPHACSTLSKSRKVPPYASFGSTTWSPGLHSARTSVSSAASPEANANPCPPPSSAASVASNAVRVGLPERLYS